MLRKMFLVGTEAAPMAAEWQHVFKSVTGTRNQCVLWSS